MAGVYVLFIVSLLAAGKGLCCLPLYLYFYCLAYFLIILFHLY